MNIEIKNLRFNKPLNQPWEFKVDRTGPIGNPFYMANEAKRDDICDKYQLYFDKQIETNREFKDYAYKILNALMTYKKVALYCWCAPKRCHAETIKNWLQKQIKE